MQESRSVVVCEQCGHETRRGNTCEVCGKELVTVDEKDSWFQPKPSAPKLENDSDKDCSVQATAEPGEGPQKDQPELPSAQDG